jgi:hypothetical protein
MRQRYAFLVALAGEVTRHSSLPVQRPPYDADFSSLFSNGGIVRGIEAKPLAAYRRRLCCLRGQAT